MTLERPDFFLASTELTAWAGPYVCRVLGARPPSGLLVRLHPAGPDCVDEVELRPRHVGPTLTPVVSEWPLIVNVLDSAGELIAVGQIHASRADADVAAAIGRTW